MRILVVTQYFHPEPFKINDCVVQLRQRGHEVCILTGLPNYPEGKLYSGYGVGKRRIDEFHGAAIRRSLLIPRGRGGGLRLAINYSSFAFFGSLDAAFRMKGPFDVILVYGLSPITAAIPGLVVKRLKKVPLVMWVQDIWPESAFELANIDSPTVKRMLNALVRRIYDRCDHLLLSSRGFSESINVFGVPAGRMSYLPNWAEDSYKPQSASAPFEHAKLLPPGFRVMFAGNIGACQDFPAIIDAAEKLRHREDIKWVIVGNGRCYEWALAEVGKRHLSETVTFLGRFPAETMPAFFCRADAMLMTLKKGVVSSLTVPAKLQTYMACGRPILTMLDGEGSRIVQEAGAGLTCGSGDSSGLAENVLKMCEMSCGERMRMGSNALEYCRQHFDRDRILDGLEDVLHAAVESRDWPRPLFMSQDRDNRAKA